MRGGERREERLSILAGHAEERTDDVVNCESSKDTFNHIIQFLRTSNKSQIEGKDPMVLGEYRGRGQGSQWLRWLILHIQEIQSPALYVSTK